MICFVLIIMYAIYKRYNLAQIRKIQHYNNLLYAYTKNNL